MTPMLALISVWLVPLLAAALVRANRKMATARVIAWVAGAGVFAIALGLYLWCARLRWLGGDAAVPLGLGVRYHLGLDGLAPLLLPIVAGVVLLVLAAAPRAELDRAGLIEALVAEAGVLGCIVARDLGVFTAFWLLSLLPLRAAARRRGDDRHASVATRAIAFSTAPLLVAVALLVIFRARTGAGPVELADIGSAVPAPVEPWLCVLVALAALVRLGAFPLHGWVPPSTARAPTPLAVLCVAAPVGPILLGRALPALTGAFAHAAPLLTGLGLLTAAYGALLAIAQRDLKRLLGFVVVSQSGLFLAGIASRQLEGLRGAFLQSLGAFVALSGLLLIAAAIEARAGTCDLRRLGGLAQKAPRMATGFLLLAFAAVGFPGTVLFVSEDLLVEGILPTHPLAVATLLLVTAVNGITLYRAYARAFLGPASPTAPQHFADLLPRERAAAVVATLALIVGGFAPTPLWATPQPGAAYQQGDEAPAPMSNKTRR